MRSKMNCPVCGAEMNHHADKVVYTDLVPAVTAEAEHVEEMHSCPRCGRVESRPSFEPRA
jgi:ribosomal protein S27AE